MRVQEGLRLDVRKLTVRKSGRTIVDNVTFSVAPGEFVAILGPNGAGKTTLLKAIAGVRPYSGGVCVSGDVESEVWENLYDNPEKWFRRIGQVPVDNVLHEGLPVVRALTYVGRLQNIPPRVLTDRIEGLLEEFHILHKSNSPIHQLSSGERKKVNICAELLTYPGLLLLDEPTTNLDPDAESELMGILAKRAKQGTTVIIVSHTINSLGACDRIILMGNSKIVKTLDNRQTKSMNPGRWIAEFKERRTKKRILTPNPPRKPIPCGADAYDTRASSPLVRHHETIKDARTAWQHYRIILSRQLALLVYEGWHIPVRETWARMQVFLLGRTVKQQGEDHESSVIFPLPLLVPVAFGLLTGLLLLLVLPGEALIQSASKGVSLDAGDASQATYLIGLVAFLVGLLGSFREVVREISIYQHERLKGLRAKAYLLAKFTVFGTLYGIVAPILMCVVLGLSQDFPSGSVVFGGSGNILLSLMLTSLSGVALGLAISCAGSTGEWATVLMGVSVIANALLSGLVKNDAWEKLIDAVSVFVPSRWALEGLKTTTQLYCWGVQRLLRDSYSPAHLLAVWIALLAYTLAALMAAYLALHYKDVWFAPLRRFKPLVSQGNYVYNVIIIIMIVAGLTLYKWSTQAHNDDLFVATVGELHGRQKVVGWMAAARCVEEKPPSPLAKEDDTPYIDAPTPTPPPRSMAVVTLVPSNANIREEKITSLAVENTPTVNVSEMVSPTSSPASTPTVTMEPTAQPNLTPTATTEPPIEPSPTPAIPGEPTAEPSPTHPVPGEPTVTVPDPVDLYFGPTTRPERKLVTLPANSTLMLLSQATHNDAPWLRVQALDGAGQGYVGWVLAANPSLAKHVWKVGLERKTPPECAIPVASTYRKMGAPDIAAGNLGTWASDGAGEVAVVVDLYRNEVGTPSDNLTLRLQLNGRDVRSTPIESQQKRFLLPNSVHNVQVSSGDRLSLRLAPTSSGTLRTLQAHVSIFFVPKDCEFHER